ncbi:hypothetical protein COLO4_04399 [Corchorus olitorius]|uniref:Uncharacterized protein n=1 Tax=Corchorus olitorius TaxID=93759 RepID=A0A1R3KU37_9ROSI|nr:hypothetical protein COLO4_04399 [Corchorus olitorius]
MSSRISILTRQRPHLAKGPAFQGGRFECDNGL